VDPKRAAQVGRRRARAHHRRTGERGVERRAAQLVVAVPLILLLDPGLRGVIEQGERQLRFAFEHRDEPPFDLRP